MNLQSNFEVLEDGGFPESPLNSRQKSAQVLDGRDARSHTHLPDMDFGEINEQGLEP